MRIMDAYRSNPQSSWKVILGAFVPSSGTVRETARAASDLENSASMSPIPRRRRSLLPLTAAAMALTAQAAQAQSAPAPPAAGNEVVITASRADLLGKAVTASQGSVTRKELELRPVYRVGQLLESVPGLVVTAHSGEGKANQYLIRGFNLDHGTDIANFIDDKPVNRPTNAHGQGYSDVYFMMPQLMQSMDYTKGPYYAAVGDFGAVASTHIRLTNDLPNQVSATLGTLGMRSAFAGGTAQFGDGDTLIGAIGLGHLDGPWTHPDSFNRVNATVRYANGNDVNGYSLTGMLYKSTGAFTTDQPARTVSQGLIGRYGTLDPTDGNLSERYSLSGHYAAKGEGWSFTGGAYAIHATMTLWNNFTHYLDDPINGDQEQQNETRDTFGGQAAYVRNLTFGAIKSDFTFGLQARYDSNYIDRRHTLHRVNLPYCEAEQASGPAIPFATINGACNADRVELLDLGPYAENTTRWTGWLRSVVGVREEYYAAQDRSLTFPLHGSGAQTLFQPKGSLILGPWNKTELYVSAGRGFHSDDVRGVFGTVAAEGIPINAGHTPLLATATGEELGLRTDIIPKVKVQLALFQQDFSSELRYNADIGQDEASAPSRRQGVEVSAEYRPWSWVELNTDLAFSKARYMSSDLAAFGLDGPFIANAPTFIGSFGALVDNLGPWFGGLQWRILGPYPVNDGVQNPQDKGYSEVNVDAGYKFGEKVRVQGSIFNLFNAKADSAAYYYAARLPGEPADGVSGLQVHPIEPISASVTVTVLF